MFLIQQGSYIKISIKDFAKYWKEKQGKQVNVQTNHTGIWKSSALCYVDG